MSFDPFGSMFDFNGDGKTDSMEIGLGMFMMNEIMKEDKKREAEELGLPFNPDDED